MTLAEEIEELRGDCEYRKPRKVTAFAIARVQAVLASHDRLVAVLRRIEDFASEGHEERYLYALDNIHEMAMVALKTLDDSSEHSA
jgi:hypothetical protein